MLQKVLDEINNSRGVLNLDELGKKLNISPGTLESMVDFLTRRGYLATAADPTEAPPCESGKTCSSGYTCPGPEECPFMIDMPRTFTLTIQEGHTEEK